LNASSLPEPAALSPATAYLASYQASESLRPAPLGQGSLVASARRMQVYDTPFSYGVIDGFLPESDYRAVIAAWPPQGELAQVSLPGSGYVGSRTAKVIDDRRAAALPAAQSSAWAGISSMLREPEFVSELFTRFADVIGTTLAALDTPSCEPGFRLYLCQDKGEQEALGAHIDGMHKLLTIVVYISLDGPVTSESPELWGTTLYDIEPRAVGPIEFAPNAGHVPSTRVRFGPNRAFIMPNSRKALHGVAGGQRNVTRRSLMCGYWAFGETV
jgi:hypothetical protein